VPGEEDRRDWRVRLEDWRARRREKAIERALQGTRGRPSDSGPGHPTPPPDGQQNPFGGSAG
jgi:hypothetical protein